VCSLPTVNTIASTLTTSISYIILTPVQLSLINTMATVKTLLEHLTDVSDKETPYVSEPPPIKCQTMSIPSLSLSPIIAEIAPFKQLRSPFQTP
jgi:hypothetical protein